jgi:hypothetical protein
LCKTRTRVSDCLPKFEPQILTPIPLNISMVPCYVWNKVNDLSAFIPRSKLCKEQQINIPDQSSIW